MLSRPINVESLLYYWVKLNIEIIVPFSLIVGSCVQYIYLQPFSSPAFTGNSATISYSAWQKREFFQVLQSPKVCLETLKLDLANDYELIEVDISAKENILQLDAVALVDIELFKEKHQYQIRVYYSSEKFTLYIFVNPYAGTFFLDTGSAFLLAEKIQRKLMILGERAS